MEWIVIGGLLVVCYSIGLIVLQLSNKLFTKPDSKLSTALIICTIIKQNSKSRRTHEIQSKLG